MIPVIPGSRFNLEPETWNQPSPPVCGFGWQSLKPGTWNLSEPGLHQYLVVVLEFTDLVPDIVVVFNLIHPVTKNAG